MDINTHTHTRVLLFPNKIKPGSVHTSLQKGAIKKIHDFYKEGTAYFVS